MNIPLNTVVLSAGRLQHRRQAPGCTADEGLTPLACKPTIAWCLNALLENGATSIVIAVRESSERLQNVIRHLFPDVRQVRVPDGNSILHSLHYALKAVELNLPTQVIVGRLCWP